MSLSLHLNKNSKLISLASTLIWLGFVFAAFKGFHFWYVGFVLFFWLSLAALNYKHETSLWLLKNRGYRFTQLYIVLVIIGFAGDFIIGQHVANLWSYPYYQTLSDWLRLYLIIYPFGGLYILELTFFLANFFHEKFAFTHSAESRSVRVINTTEHILDALLPLFAVSFSLLHFWDIEIPFPHLTVYGFLLWTAVTTLAFTRHIRHGLHWFAILLAVLFISVFLHEVPNTAVFEWKYHVAPVLNPLILEIPLWVFIGWYVMIIVMLRVWIRFVWAKK